MKERVDKPWKRFKKPDHARILRQRAALAKGVNKNHIALSKWSSAVRERDNYICQRCGKYDKANHAHHRATRSRRPDLKFDLANGVTLCPKDHRWVHDHPIEATAMGLLSDESYERVRKEAA